MIGLLKRSLYRLARALGFMARRDAPPSEPPTLALNADPQETAGILAYRVERASCEPASCTLTLRGRDDAGGLAHLDRSDVDFGAELTLRHAGAELFSGRVVGIEARLDEAVEPRVIVHATDALEKLRLTTRTRSFHDVSAVDIFQQIAGDHGLQLDGGGAGGPTWKHVAQVAQSDLDLVRALAAAIDVDVYADQHRLKVRRSVWDDAWMVRDQPGELALGSNLHSFQAHADLRGQRTATVAAGWDVSSKDVVSHEETTALSEELGNDLSGSGALAAALGSFETTASGAVLVTTSAEAETSAESEFRRRGRRFVTAHARVTGDASLRPGLRLRIRGVGELFEGEYRIVRTVHLFDTDEGFRTELELERPGVGR